MTKRIIAIAVIFIFTSIAWGVLGGTIFIRTESQDNRLKGKVRSIWGTPHEQAPPTATTTELVPKTEVVVENGRKIERTVQERVSVPLPLTSSQLDVRLDLEHRQKGLLWYSTYKVAFAGTYTFTNASEKEQSVIFTLDFPAAQAIYDDFTFTVNGQAVAVINQKSSATGNARIRAGETGVLRVGYRSQGLDAWRYKFGGDIAQVRDFTLRMTTNFKDIDFPESTLSPTEKIETSDGWDLRWSYKSLLSGFEIGMALPEKLQPGPLAGRISFFAPVSLFFFFFLIFIITTLRGIELHPMNYFFIAAAFFSFHLLLAYLVDLISIHLAFTICSVVSIGLVVSYLRLVLGIRFAAVEAGLAQLTYLVFFSYAFFFKGFTGLTITIGSILTLFIVMQMTGRIRWAEKFAAPPA